MSNFLTIIGKRRFISQSSWLEEGCTEEDFKVVKEYVLQSWERFQEVIAEIAEAHKRKWGVFEGKEIMGHGESQTGGSFSLRDYTYVEEVIKPVLRHYRVQQPEGWQEFWSNVCSTEFDAENPIYLKRSAVPLLFEDLQKGKEDAMSSLDVLKGYITIDDGIPNLEKAIFVFARGKKDAVFEEPKIVLLTTLRDLYVKRGFWYFENVFAFEVLLQLCESERNDVKKEAHSMVRQWLEDCGEKIVDVDRRSNVSYHLDKLLRSPESNNLLCEIMETYLQRGEAWMEQEDFMDPTCNLYRILVAMIKVYPESAERLLHKMIVTDSSKAYTERLIALTLHSLQRNPETAEEARKIQEKFAGSLSEHEQAKLKIELADRLSKSEKNEEKENAYEICKAVLTDTAHNFDSIRVEYKGSDDSLNEDLGGVFPIVGAEGQGLFVLQRFAEEHPKEVYGIALKYWKDSDSPYLMYMAGFPLYVALHYLVYKKEGGYRYKEAKGYFDECVGRNLNIIKESPYTLIGLWQHICNIVATLRPALTYDEVQAFLEMGEGREHTHWALPYYAKFAEEYVWKRWKSEEVESIKSQLDAFLADKSRVDDLTQLLTNFRNRVRQGSSTAQDVEMAQKILEAFPQRHHKLISAMGHLLIDAAEKGDEKYLPLVELYYSLWIIPFIEGAKDYKGFVYVPRTPDVLKWYCLHKKEDGQKLAKQLSESLSEEWQHRIFQDLNLESMINCVY